MANGRVKDDIVIPKIQELMQFCGGDPKSFDGELITQVIHSGLKLITDGHNTGQLKLINRSLKEMRYAYRVFNQYLDKPIVAIFGSARTPEDHPDYIAAKEFSKHIADQGWMIITGASSGIMKAGHEGPSTEASFGLSIYLPLETTTNPIIEGDPKHISFRYFFTRKLMFLTHAQAVAAFPGGLGTMDELFEVLTLLQTGKASLLPVVLLAGIGNYWQHWDHFVKENLLRQGWISSEDQNLYHIATSVSDAIQHIQKFYKRFHSYRYVKENLVIRIKSPLNESQMEQLNDQFASLVKEGKIIQREAFPEESQLIDLPRLAFYHTRKNFGMLRKLIDQINDFN